MIYQWLPRFSYRSYRIVPYQVRKTVRRPLQPYRHRNALFVTGLGAFLNTAREGDSGLVPSRCKDRLGALLFTSFDLRRRSSARWTRDCTAGARLRPLPGWSTRKRAPNLRLIRVSVQGWLSDEFVIDRGFLLDFLDPIIGDWHSHHGSN